MPTFLSPLGLKIGAGIMLALAVLAFWRVSERAQHWHDVAKARATTIVAVATEVRRANGWAANVRIPDADLAGHVRAQAQAIVDVRAVTAKAVRDANANAARVATSYLTLERQANETITSLRNDYRTRLAASLRNNGTAATTDRSGANITYRAASPACAGTAAQDAGCALVSARDLGLAADWVTYGTVANTFILDTAAVATSPTP